MQKDDVIYRQAAIDMLKNRWKKTRNYEGIGDDIAEECELYLKQVPSAQPEERTKKRTETHTCDCISRSAVYDRVSRIVSVNHLDPEKVWFTPIGVKALIKEMPPAQPEQRYTEEELRVFQHGISLSLLSKRSAQHWSYDEDTATEIEFLERLYEKVSADIRGETI